MTNQVSTKRLRQGLEAILALEGNAYLLPIGHPDAEERQMLAQSVVHNIARVALEEAETWR